MKQLIDALRYVVGLTPATPVDGDTMLPTTMPQGVFPSPVEPPAGVPSPPGSWSRIKIQSKDPGTMLKDNFAGGMGAGVSNHFEPDTDSDYQQTTKYDTGDDLWSASPPMSKKSMSNSGRKNTGTARNT